jgi:MFS family permease
MFLLDDSDIATLYALPFLVGLALPGRRSLVIMGCIGLAVAACASATSGGGVASALGLLFVLTAIGGLCCGLLTRATTLWIAPLSRHPYRFMAIAVVGYVLPPVACSGPAETMAWLKRPSQQVCAAADYRVTAANMTLQVRATPVFAVDVLHAIGSTYVRHLWFDSKQGLKEICGRGLRDNQVIGPVAVNLYPWMFGGSHVQSWATATCASARDETLILVCRLAEKAHPARRMERATIYGPDMDAAILRNSNYAIEKQLHQRLIETNEPFVLVCEGDEASSHSGSPALRRPSI